MRSLFLLLLAVAVCFGSIYHHHHNHRRNYRRHQTRPLPVKRIHVRSERNANECQKHEHHLICGPERHCDRSCDNLFSPPQCVNTLHHAKCYYPRCVCNDGYVRDANDVCIKPSHCPNTYYEPASMLQDDSANDMMVQFKPVRFSRIGRHKVLRVARKQAIAAAAAKKKLMI